MKKILFFNFDGTCNDPMDAVQNRNSHGMIEDDNITNVLKFHLLLGGDLKEGGTSLPNGSHSFYYSGVGTYGSKIKQLINTALAPEEWDVEKIENKAIEDFKKYYLEKKGFDKIISVGFSRGAAIARRFASKINDLVPENTIIEGIFETVASIDRVDFCTEDRPKSEVVFENRTVASKVEKALHLVSLDDKRKAFQPTLMNKEDKVMEVWFSGAHGDVGGGFRQDGLSDLSLRFFLDWFEDLGLGIKFYTPKTLDYSKFKDMKGREIIGADDMHIIEDPFGVNHEQDRWGLIEKITLIDRKCCVIVDDKIKYEEEPIVHWSVAERIFGDSSYKPASLKGKPHKILYPDGRMESFKGFTDHKYICNSNILIPTGEGIETFIYAHKKFNHTRIFFEEGKSYKIEVLGDERWNDSGIKDLDGKGWDRKDVKLGLKESFIKILESRRRVTKKGVKWFTLCGTIGPDDSTAFIIGNSLKKYSANKSGEFCAFANDLNGFYGNNTGKLRVKVTLL